MIKANPKTQQEYDKIYDYEEDNQVVLRVNYKVKYTLCMIYAFICMFLAGFILYVAELSPDWNKALIKVVYYLFIVLIIMDVIFFIICVTTFISTYFSRNLNEKVIHKTTYRGGFMLRKPSYVKYGDSVEWIWLCPGLIKLYLMRYLKRKAE